jgi:hypothetical protein
MLGQERHGCRDAFVRLVEGKPPRPPRKRDASVPTWVGVHKGAPPPYLVRERKRVGIHHRVLLNHGSAQRGQR